MASSIRLVFHRLPTLTSRIAIRQSAVFPRLRPAATIVSRVEFGRKLRLYYTSTADETEPISKAHTASIFAPLDTFQRRHIGPSSDEIVKMLTELNYSSLDAFVKDVLPPSILSARNLNVAPQEGFTETQLLERLKSIAKQNRSDLRSFIGCGYAGTATPNVILRNILECPEWYTSYTPYQPEISQGTSSS